MTPSEHYDNLAIACIKKASELEALADQSKDREQFKELATRERKEAISYLEMAKTLAAHP
jgi:hypothetical protein